MNKLKSSITEKKDMNGKLISRKVKLTFYNPDTEDIILFFKKLKKSGGKIEKIDIVSTDKIA
ncbi:MAG TPA: hypothetical protein PK564_02860 [bacterium]|nr:hypothetical protein [bacterium]